MKDKTRNNCFISRFKIAVWFLRGIKERPVWTLSCPECDGIFLDQIQELQTDNSYSATYVCKKCGKEIKEIQTWKNKNLTSADTYDSDFSVEEIQEQTKRHFEEMQKLMND